MADKSHIEFIQFKIKRNRKNEFLKLNDVNGYDLLTEIKSIFSVVTVHNFRKIERTISIQDEPNIDLANRMIYGMIEVGKTGESGTIRDADDYENEEKTREIKNGDTIEKNFFYLFHIPSKSERGFIILHRLGNTGIKTAITTLLREELKNVLTTDYRIDFDRAFPKELARQFLEFGGIKEMKLTKNNLPLEVAERFGLNYFDGGTAKIEIRIIPQKKSTFNRGKKLNAYLKDNDVDGFYTTKLFENIGYNNNDHNRTVRVVYDGNQKTINLSNPADISSHIVVEEELNDPKYKGMTLLNKLFLISKDYLRILLGDKNKEIIVDQ